MSLGLAVPGLSPGSAENGVLKDAERTVLSAGRVLQVAAVFGLAVGFGCARESTPVPSTPLIAFDTSRTSATFGLVSVTGLSPDAFRAIRRVRLSTAGWSSLLTVRTSADTTSPAVLGNYGVSDNGLWFTPRFPPVPGVTYHVRFDPGSIVPAARADSATFVVPVTAAAPTTVVEAVYPSSARVPVNLLKMYIHFSAPMRMGDAIARLHLLDSSGVEVKDAFLVTQDELWDTDRRRLTLLFDPGRIKEDIRPHEELGLPLQQGRRYRLVIDRGWRDANGAPLREGFEKAFVVAGQDRASPRTDDWHITAPHAGTTEPLRLSFPEPLDQALLMRMIEVRNPNGESVAGDVRVTEGETRWLFTPVNQWRAGRYVIRIDADLEDLAGNTLIRLFDQRHRTMPANTPEVIEVSFDVSR